MRSSGPSDGMASSTTAHPGMEAEGAVAGDDARTARRLCSDPPGTSPSRAAEFFSGAEGQEVVANDGDPNGLCATLPGCVLTSDECMGAAKLVADEYFAQVSDDDADLLAVPSLLDDSGEACDTRSSFTTFPESAEDSEASLEEAVALEVGASAEEYLEECFHFTEVSVLDKEKFEAVPEISKGDFTILGHLGKGSFSDVFEVVLKGGQIPGSPGISSCADDGRLDKTTKFGRRRPSRAHRGALAMSVCSATRAGPSHSSQRSEFALKCLRPQIRSDVEQFSIGAEDLVHETAVLATLSHPHIIRLHGRASGRLADAFVLNDGYFVLLERLSGTLTDRIADWGRDPARLRGPMADQLGAVRDVADAMAYLHSKRIVFRDLKPANVGFDAGGVVKLFDFGFAAGLPEKDRHNPSGLLFDRCGTPRYMAPEVGLDRGYGIEADAYSLGILLWEVCSMSKPFADITDPNEFDRRVFEGKERPEIDERWPETVRSLMARCWSHHPRGRPSMRRARSVLSNGAGEKGSQAKVASLRSSLPPGLDRMVTR